MTNEQINRAIAEQVGWTDVHFYEDDAGPPIHCGYPPGIRHYATIPRYSTDLNAMNEAEKTLTDRDAYLRELQTVTQTWDHVDADGDEVDWFWELATATAIERAEAFLRTIGKWKENE